MQKIEENLIHVLDIHTANQIAAGEVVEKPASVVKELVENAIDAGATIIDVRVFDAECQKIQVADNGGGMSPADMRLAMQRHATSKIHRAEDLTSLTSLGFRGEALPAIAAVSQFCITSKQPGADRGYTMTVRDGKAGIPAEAAAKEGTVMVVDRLFYNTPARKKFLKSARSEFAAISELMVKLALSRPGISFTLRHGTKNIFATAGSGDLDVAIISTYGRETADNLIRLEHLGHNMMYGLISLPSLTRANRQEYNFFVNGRWVKSRELERVVDDAYDTLLPARRFPLVFLFFELDPSNVDVNVHPAKLEIKLREPDVLREELTEAIATAFSRREILAPRLGNLNRPLASAAVSTDPSASAFRLKEKQLQQKLPLLEPPNSANLYDVLYDKKSLSVPQEPSFSVPQEPSFSVPQEPSFSVPQEPSFSMPQEPSLRFSSLRPLGQAASSYIVAEGEDGLYVIDQHAAAERIMYEKIVAVAKEQPSASAMLAMAVPLELTYAEKTLLVDKVLELKELGFILEYFGDNSFVIRGVPLWYQGSEPETLLRLVVEQLTVNRGDVAALRREKLFQEACKQAIKANRRLNFQDITALFRDLDACTQPFTCPHGRPVIIKLDYREIRKRFLRGSI